MAQSLRQLVTYLFPLPALTPVAQQLIWDNMLCSATSNRQTLQLSQEQYGAVCLITGDASLPHQKRRTAYSLSYFCYTMNRV